MRVLAAVLLALVAPAVLADAAVRPNSLIFNEVVTLAEGHTATLPLYLTRRGEYFAEAILERNGAGERVALSLDLNVRIARRDEVLFERDVTAALGADRPAATLFYLTSDREVPIKTPLEIALRIDELSPLAGEESLRIQIRRKPNPGFRGVW